MKPTFLRLYRCKVTFFTRPYCGLCDDAKKTLSNAWDVSKNKFDYKEIDITGPENKDWFDKYVSL